MLSHAQPSRLQELVYSPWGEDDRIAPDAPMLKAISRFTALTVLHLTS